jgi:hypothetical protein
MQFIIVVSTIYERKLTILSYEYEHKPADSKSILFGWNIENLEVSFFFFARLRQCYCIDEYLKKSPFVFRYFDNRKSNREKRTIDAWNTFRTNNANIRVYHVNQKLQLRTASSIRSTSEISIPLFYLPPPTSFLFSSYLSYLTPKIM